MNLEFSSEKNLRNPQKIKYKTNIHKLHALLIPSQSTQKRETKQVLPSFTSVTSTKSVKLLKLA